MGIEKFLLEKQKKELFETCNTVADVIAYSQKIINLLIYCQITNQDDTRDILNNVNYHIDLIQSKLNYQIASTTRLLEIK
jgi:hypothetical protein